MRSRLRETSSRLGRVLNSVHRPHEERPATGPIAASVVASMVFLHRADLVTVLLQGGDSERCRAGAGERGHDWGADHDGRGSDLHLVGTWRGTTGRVDHELNLFVF